MKTRHLLLAAPVSEMGSEGNGKIVSPITRTTARRASATSSLLTSFRRSNGERAPPQASLLRAFPRPCKRPGRLSMFCPPPPACASFCCASAIKPQSRHAHAACCQQSMCTLRAPSCSLCGTSTAYRLSSCLSWSPHAHPPSSCRLALGGRLCPGPGLEAGGGVMFACSFVNGT